MMKNTNQRLTNKGSKIFLYYEDAMPYIALEEQLINLYRKKIKDINADKLSVFVCKSAFIKGLDKPLYIFEEFYFTEKGDKIEYDNEYVILAYNNDIEQCGYERDLFLKNKSTDIPILNANNKQSPDFKEGLTNLTLLDIVYLQNLRMFIRINNDNIEAGLFYPHLDFTIQEININIRYPSVPICRRLLNKDEESFKSKTFGYLTITVKGTYLPLIHDADEEITKYAIVGVWTFGEDITEQSLNNCKSTQLRVWGLLTHFFKYSKISYRFTFTKEKASFLLISFNKNIAPRAFSFKMTDKMEMNAEIKLDQYKVYYKDVAEYLFNDKRKRDNTYNIDFSMIPKEPSLHTSFELQKSNNNLRNDRLVSTTGIQAEMKESIDSDLSLVKYLKDYQDKNESFYKKTIERMQDQIGLLSQAIASINQNLAILNQKVMNNNTERITDTFILPDLITNSLSISESSNNIIFPDDLKGSKTLSEVQVVNTINKHKRYKTNDIETIKEKDLDSLREPNSFDKPIEPNSLNNKLERTSSFVNTSTVGLAIIKKTESIGPEDIEIRNPIMVSLNQMNDAIEYDPKNENTGSIPIPKINPKFKRYVPSSDSDISDKEGNNYKRSTQK